MPVSERPGRRQRRAFLAGLTVVLAVILALAAPALAAEQTITSVGPLDRIFLNDTLGCQATHTAAAPGEPGSSSRVSSTT